MVFFPAVQLDSLCTATNMRNCVPAQVLSRHTPLPTSLRAALLLCAACVSLFILLLAAHVRGQSLARWFRV